MKKIIYLFAILFISLILTGCKKTYRVMFDTDEGSYVETQEVKKGKNVVKPVDPTKEGYIFLYWELNGEKYNFKEEVTKNITLLAKWEKELPKYHIQYNLNGGNLPNNAIREFTDFSNVELPIPTKEGYEFLGWYESGTKKEQLTFNRDHILTAEWAVQRFTVLFKYDNGETIKKLTVEYGASLTIVEVNKPGYMITWNKTNDDLVNIKENIEVIATATECAKNCKYYIDGALVSEYNGMFTDEVEEPKYPDNTKNHVWNTTYEIINNVYYYTYVLEYDVKGGIVKYFDGTKELALSPSSYITGEEFDLPTPPVKDGYIFDGWYLSDLSFHRYTHVDENTDGDLYFYAKYIAKVGDFSELTSTYQLQGIETVNNLLQPKLPSDAPSQTKKDYTWTSSDNTIATISSWSTLSAVSSGFVVITGTYINDPTITVSGIYKITTEGIFYSNVAEANDIILHEVTFVDKNEDPIMVVTVVDGGDVIAPIPPVYSGFAFTGWNQELYNIKNDLIVKATYREGINNYTGKKISILGDSISTYQGYVPDNYKVFYPASYGDVKNVYHTWWMQAISKLGGSLFTNNSYAGSCVSSGTGDSSATTDIRLSTLLAGGQAPDVIIINLGANDCGSSYVGIDIFDESYNIMLTKLKKLCPNAEIILCTLPNAAGFYEIEEQAKYNNVITKYAQQYGLRVIDFSNINMSGYLVDAVHPAKNGMTLLANKVIETLTK